MLIQVSIRSAYGNTLADPMNGTAKTIANMVNRKTLTRRDLHHCLTLGMTLEVYSHGVCIATATPSNLLPVALEKLP